MILGSDSHTRYGVLGTMGIGEGGGEIAKQLLKKTYDIPYPKVIAVKLTGAPKPGVGPQDVALALIAATFKNGFNKNKVLEFVGDGISNLSVEYRMGIDVIMLTGDNKRTARGIAKDLNLTDTIADVLPQDKERVVAELRDAGRIVAMVGDGVNDAPALVRADVGVAIGAGTDVAIESADVVLMKNDLLDVANAIRLSKAVIRNIKQNLFWAFFYNCIGIPLAAGIFYIPFGWKLTPDFGAFAMSFSSIFVCTNALRLKAFKIDKNKSEEPVSNPVTLPVEEESRPVVTEERAEDYNTTIKIEGMMCSHCTGRVDKALNDMDGVKATVSLEGKSAEVELTKDISDEALVKAVTDAGYEVVDIQ